MIEGVGNYLIVSNPQLGNSLIVSIPGGSCVRDPTVSAVVPGSLASAPGRVSAWEALLAIHDALTLWLGAL